MSSFFVKLKKKKINPWSSFGLSHSLYVRSSNWNVILKSDDENALEENKRRSFYFHSQHFGVFDDDVLPVSRCCINSCCRLTRKATSSLITCLICVISCCNWRIAVHSWRKVGVISSFSKPICMQYICFFFWGFIVWQAYIFLFVVKIPIFMIFLVVKFWLKNYWSDRLVDVGCRLGFGSFVGCSCCVVGAKE